MTSNNLQPTCVPACVHPFTKIINNTDFSSPLLSSSSELPEELSPRLVFILPPITLSSQFSHCVFFSVDSSYIFIEILSFNVLPFLPSFVCFLRSLRLIILPSWADHFAWKSWGFSLHLKSVLTGNYTQIFLGTNWLFPVYSWNRIFMTCGFMSIYFRVFLGWGIIPLNSLLICFVSPLYGSH